MKPRAPQIFAHFTALGALALGLAACSQGSGEPTGSGEQPAEAVKTGETTSPPHADHARRDPRKLIEKFDANKNGTLELSELPPPLRERFESADTDKNGSLSVAELDAHKKQMGERLFALQDENKDGFLTEDEVGKWRWSKIVVADSDKNGKLSKAELEAAHENGTFMPFAPHGGPGMHGMRGMHGMHGMRGFAKDPQKLIEKFDANDNGTLELSELPPPLRERLESADTDKNGSLSVGELEAHKKRMGERLFALQDENKDGFLTEDEVGKWHWKRLSVADTDKDGKVSKAELEAAHRDGKLGPPAGGPGMGPGFWEQNERHNEQP